MSSFAKSLARRARRAVLVFDRGKLPFATTMVRQVTKQHLEHINDVFWLHERAHAHIRGGFVNIPRPTPQTPPRGIFNSAGKWESAADDLQIWLRQNILISAASILEVYIVSASTASFEARPELVDRSLIGADSLKYLKFPDLRPARLKKLIKQNCGEFTKGAWLKRFRSMEIVLGVIPKSVKDLTDDLQDLQNLRNRIAHSYGTDGELRRTPWEPVRAIQVTIQQITKAFGIVDEVSKTLDKYVFGPNIGGFEMFNEYTNWAASQVDFHQLRVMSRHYKAFKEHVGRAFGAPPSEAYVRGLIRHYDSIQR